MQAHIDKKMFYFCTVAPENEFSCKNRFLGIQTSEDARFYAISRKFEPFSNKDSPLVVQFTVKHEQNIDCGGGYVKVFDCSLNQEDMHGETPYLLMFGKNLHLRINNFYDFYFFKCQFLWKILLYETKICIFFAIYIRA